ncbi:MAG: hypothetical protein ACYCOU_00260 [Sulfobacillus sp.]
MTLTKKHIFWDVALAGTMFAGMVTYQGCKTATATTATQALAPGYANQQDMIFGESLSALHGFVGSLLSQETAGTFQPSATQKNAINALTLSVNAADASYMAYKQGTQTAAQVQAAITTAQSQQSALQSTIPTAVK